jgi:dienelactone hydrolase
MIHAPGARGALNRAGIALVLAGLAVLVAATPKAHAFDPAVEAQNFSKIEERASIYATPQYQALLRQVGLQNQSAAVAMAAADPERNYLGFHLCATGEDGCAGDARLYDWEAKGYGLVEPVLFTARSGATISGHVWATRSGPAKRPGIVITNGSVQAPERLYWFVAQTLAKAGYVVLTSDPQGQGQSDERGEAPDEDEGSPAQTDGRPFYDGTVDALDFFLSTPKSQFKPRPSCESGTSHAPKQNRRVLAGLNAPYNPLWKLVNASRIGIAGHSFGAAGVSFVGQKDPRVSAIVAWDNLGRPGTTGGLPVKPCPADPASHEPAPITKPALGMSADYGLTPNPNTSDPDPLAKSAVSREYSDAGVDTGELVIRGGTHYEFSLIPNPAFGGTLRGADLTAWYTTAWFDKYVKRDGSADRRLVTKRWQADAHEASVDPNHDGNMFSFYSLSRLDFRRAGGGRFRCEDMRTGCAGLTSNDGWNGDYSYLGIAVSPDRP